MAMAGAVRNFGNTVSGRNSIYSKLTSPIAAGSPNHGPVNSMSHSKQKQQISKDIARPSSIEVDL